MLPGSFSAPVRSMFLILEHFQSDVQSKEDVEKAFGVVSLLMPMNSMWHDLSCFQRMLPGSFSAPVRSMFLILEHFQSNLQSTGDLEMTFGFVSLLMSKNSNRHDISGFQR
jgi:hypothetical protein